MNLSSMPSCANSTSVMVSITSLSSRTNSAGGSLAAEAGRVAQVGEQHRQLLLLAAELEQRRVARHLIDQSRAQIVLERRAQPALLALADEVFVQHDGRVQRHEREQRREQVEPEAPREGPEIDREHAGHQRAEAERSGRADGRAGQASRSPGRPGRESRDRAADAVSRGGPRNRRAGCRRPPWRAIRCPA